MVGSVSSSGSGLDHFLSPEPILLLACQRDRQGHQRMCRLGMQIGKLSKATKHLPFLVHPS